METRAPEPADAGERGILLGWLAFHRDALAAKCADLTDDQLAARPVPPSALSLLGLVRHLTEMERVYAAWALGPAVPLEFVWGAYTDGGPDWDFLVDPSLAAGSLAAWEREKRAADAAVAGHPDLLRETLDGRTGE